MWLGAYSILLGGRTAGTIGDKGVLGVHTGSTGASGAATANSTATTAAVPAYGGSGMSKASIAAAADRTAAADDDTAVSPAAAVNTAVHPKWCIGKLTLAGEDSDGGRLPGRPIRGECPKAVNPKGSAWLRLALVQRYEGTSMPCLRPAHALSRYSTTSASLICLSALYLRTPPVWLCSGSWARCFGVETVQTHCADPLTLWQPGPIATVLNMLDPQAEPQVQGD